MIVHLIQRGLHNKKGQEQCQSQKDHIGRSRLRIQRRSGKMQYNDDARKRRHHNKQRRRKRNQSQRNEDAKRTVQRSIPIVIGHGHRICDI